MIPSKHSLFGAAALLLSTLCTGCVGTPEAFAKKSAKISCINIEECEKELFDAEYDSQSDCRDKTQKQFDELNAAQEEAGCEYQKDKARTCISAANKNKKECGEVEADASCQEVWSCPDPTGELERGEDQQQLQAQLEDAAPEHVAPFVSAMYGIYQ